MLLFKDERLFFEAQRCCQCGTCLAACSVGALYTALQSDGTSTIICNDKSCTGCKQCVAACPAHYLPKKLLTEQELDSFRDVWLGYATDYAMRFAASSGGVARNLVATALRSGFCDKSYCVVQSLDFPWAKGQYLCKDDDVFSQLANSMYLPILVNQNLRKSLSGTVLLVVGTNCQLIAAERFYRNSDIGLVKVAIFCKQQKTKKFTDFLRHRLQAKEDMPFKYRGNGWPGSVSSAGCALLWEDAAGLPFGKRLWRIPGCRFCGNPLGVNADLTLADPWGIVSPNDGGGGKTLIFVHTEMGQKLLQIANSALELDPVSFANAKLSIDWPGIKKQQARIHWRMGQVRSPWMRLLYSIGDLQCKLYEKLLERVTLRSLFLKIINRIPYLG